MELGQTAEFSIHNSRRNMPQKTPQIYTGDYIQTLKHAAPSEEQRFVQHGYDAFHVDPGCRKKALPGTQKPVDKVDSGYAWVVCFAACMLYATTDGMCFSLGILFPVFQEIFKESAFLTSWISSILLGCMLLSGPLVSYLVARFGARKICFIGALMAASGFLISTMATGVWFLIGSLGCMTGFGFGCMMIPALVSVTTWFEKRRPLAMGISICGAGLGMFLYSSLVAFLVEQYGLSGCFLVVGGVLLNGCVYGLLLRPAPVSKHQTPDVVGIQRSRFDLSIFRNWKYDVFLLACFLFALGFFPPFMFVVSRAVIELDWSLHEAGFLLTIIAICNTCGRLLCGITLSLPCVNKAVYLAFMMAVGGTAVSLSTLCKTYPTLVVFCTFYGLSGGFSFVGLPTVMAELVLPQHAEISSGFFVFSFGVAALLGIPSAAGLVQATGGNFTLLFLIAGSVLGMAAVLIAGIAFASRIVKR